MTKKTSLYIALMIIGPMPVYPVLGHSSMFPRPTESLIHPRAGFRGWALCGVEGDIVRRKREEERERGEQREEGTKDMDMLMT